MTSHATRSSTRRKAKGHRSARQAGSDAAVYLGLLMIGAFAVLLTWLFLQNVMEWTHAAVGYLIAMAGFINVFAWQAYLGKPLPNWQQALARVPLRMAGFGTRGGKPITAAKGQPEVRTTLMLFGAGSVLLIAGASVLLI